MPLWSMHVNAVAGFLQELTLCIASTGEMYREILFCVPVVHWQLNLLRFMANVTAGEAVDGTGTSLTNLTILVDDR